MESDIAMNESDTVVFNRLAEQYQHNKNHMIENTLKAGQVVNLAKESLSHGQFLNWVEDFRVGESLRTCQRLLAIHGDFGHLLNDENNLKVINGLGITHLLELKKLPDRFRKDIEVVKEVDGKEIRELKKVIDESKLGDFLDTIVEYNGKPMHMKELPVAEMNKQIRHAQGIFEPDSFDNDHPVEESDTMGVGSDSSELTPILADQENGSNPVKMVNEKLSSLLDLCYDLISELNKLDDSEITTSSDNDVNLLKEITPQFKSAMEGIYVKLNNIKFN